MQCTYAIHGNFPEVLDSEILRLRILSMRIGRQNKASLKERDRLSANLRPKILDFRGLDSTRGWNSQAHGGFPRPIGNFPRFLVCGFLVRGSTAAPQARRAGSWRPTGGSAWRTPPTLSMYVPPLYIYIYIYICTCMYHLGRISWGTACIL